MSATVLERHYQDRVQSLRQMAQPGNGAPALSGQDFEDLAALCLELAQAGQELLETEFKRIFKKPDLTVTWIRERRQAVEEQTDNFLNLLAALRNLVCQSLQNFDSQRGHEIVARLDEASRILAEARERMFQRWPLFTQTPGPEEEYLDADEAFAQITGVDAETWRQRREKRKQLLQDGAEAGG
jgi:hypothetical protein